MVERRVRAFEMTMPDGIGFKVTTIMLGGDVVSDRWLNIAHGVVQSVSEVPARTSSRYSAASQTNAAGLGFSKWATKPRLG